MGDETKADSDCQALLDFLKSNRGFDFTGYKRASLMRRLQKRMDMVGCADCDSYIDHLEVHPDEFEQLFNTILINVTGFFRDPQVWDSIRDTILPALLTSKSPTDPIRVWTAGCASGEEAYTVAMLLAEQIGLEGVRDRVKIYATDVDEEALQEARHATYPRKAVQAVPQELQEKYFKPFGSGFILSNELRHAVIFGRHDLIYDAPISKIDLLSCRNTLMYFNSEVQSKILSRFHFALNPRSVLLVGKAEMLFTHAHLFSPADIKCRVFTKVTRPKSQDRSLLGQSVSEADPSAAFKSDYAHLLESVFNTTESSQIVIDQSHTVVLMNQRARTQFRLMDRDLGKLIQDLEVSYRPVELRSLIDQAVKERRTVSLKDVSYTGLSGLPNEIGYLDVQVTPVVRDDSQVGTIITFSDVTRYRQLQDELRVTNHELETAYEELQSTNEELETTNEELQSAIEELETTNEELQSTNEELETMNEELQSTNEEMQAINNEMQQRSLDLDHVNRFMRSILSSFNLGVIVVGQDMNIDVWNRHSEELWGLRAEEVVDKNFLKLDFGLPLDHIRKPLGLVLNGESDGSEVSLSAVNRRGKPIELKVSISSLDGMNDSSSRGAILLMEQIHDDLLSG